MPYTLRRGRTVPEHDASALAVPDDQHLFQVGIHGPVGHSEDELVEEVMVTVVHEIAHHFGIDDDKLHEWGWG